VVNAFLLSHENFELVPFTVGDITSDSGMLTLIPMRHGTDGFFVAKIRRKI
jgi:16S rRNA (cytosine967-C5)-methyltransferase